MDFLGRRWVSSETTGGTGIGTSQPTVWPWTGSRGEGPATDIAALVKRVDLLEEAADRRFLDTVNTLVHRIADLEREVAELRAYSPAPPREAHNG